MHSCLQVAAANRPDLDQIVMLLPCLWEGTLKLGLGRCFHVTVAVVIACTLQVTIAHTYCATPRARKHSLMRQTTTPNWEM
ncbi:hypothetical protein PUN4_740004 [Paraburkholderia unamae]|nr:hypothetical protein PUN4_740004 [Paraburkholderia unamae]